MDELTIWVDKSHGELPVRDAILAITDDWVEYGNCCNATVVDLRDACAALLAEVERLREERRWICVHDRLPEPYEHVLVHRFGETDKAYLTAPPQGLWYRAADDAPIDPEYWQPLPAPPVEEE